MAFIFGFLAALFALVLQVVVWLFYPDLFRVSTPLTAALVSSLVFLAFSEECARSLFTRQYLKNYAHHHVVFAVIFFGIGFSFPEIILTYWNGFSWAVFGASAFHLGATALTFYWLRQGVSNGGTAILIMLMTALHVFFNLSFLL